MSVRFFKIFSCVLLAHVIFAVVLWVGFPQPLSKPGVVFVYQGANKAEDVTRTVDVLQRGRIPDQVIPESFLSAYSNQWVRLREGSKVLKNDYLGF